MFVHPPRLVLSSVTISNEIFCGSFLIKNHVVICVPTTLAKQISFCNHMNKKIVGDKHNVLIQYLNVCAPDPSGVVLCNPFKWDILLFFLIKNLIICVPAITVKCFLFLNHSTGKVVGGKHNVQVHLCGSLCTWLIWCCPLQPFKMR